MSPVILSLSLLPLTGHNSRQTTRITDKFLIIGNPGDTLADLGRFPGHGSSIQEPGNLNSPSCDYYTNEAV